MNPPRASVPPPPSVTLVEVVYPAHRGVIGLRGSHEPLSWEHTFPVTSVEGNRHLFELPIPPGVVIELKVVRGEEETWAEGRNYGVHAGDHLLIEPYFERGAPHLAPAEQLGNLTFEVLLPPGYEEQEHKRYPVLYMLDGQSLWSSSSDPFGVWNLEHELSQLYELGAIAELIVVGVHTADRRIESLSPVPDDAHGGGEAEALLAAIIDQLKPTIDERHRTLPAREHTALMGSSMGALFAFFAGMKRADVFGKIACLSSSFWWANRWAVRWAESNPLPEPRPVLYLDSGAAPSADEQDAQVKDGYHHTRSMVRALTAAGYRPGTDLHRLVFTGARHEAAAWAARVGLPLQLLFPVEAQRPEAAEALSS